MVGIRFYEDSYWSVIVANVHLWKSTSSNFNTRLSRTRTLQAGRGPHTVLQRALIARICNVFSAKSRLVVAIKLKLGIGRPVEPHSVYCSVSHV